LVGSPWTDEALSRLDALYRQAGDQLGLSDVLAFRAERTRDPVEARELAVKALELRTAGARDSEASIAAYQSFAERFGPSRELHARLLPLLEQTGRFAEVADVLLREIELVQPSERGPLWARLGQVRLSRLSDARGALEAFSRAFSIDSSDRTARAGLERLLAIESTRIAAADLLEPVYRSSGTPAELLKVLEARAEGESTVEGRLTARDEVIYLAENELGDPDRALEHAVRALRDALENDPSAAPDWSVVVLRLAPSCTSPARRAELLLWAAGSLDVVSQESFELARAAGDAAVAAGDIERGIEVYRRALLFDPSSRELVQRIDELLAQMGAPEERLSLYAAALARESDPARRRELLHALARLQRVELGDRAGATATLRTAVSEDPRDFAAHEALVQVLGEAGDFAAVRAELERVLPLVDAERRPAVLEELARATERAGDAAGALAYYRELLATVEPEDAVLTKIEELALSASDVVTLETVLDRRLGTALEPARRAELLERRGDLAQKGRDDVTLAARLWFEAARLYEGTLGDGASAVRLYSRVLEADATHTEAAERLVELCAEIGDFEKLRAAFDLLVASGGEREVAGTLLKIENRARESGQGELFAALADVALARVTEAARRRSLLLAKARALGAVPEAADTASALFRTLVGEPSSELFAAAAEAFADFLRRAPRTAARIDDLRWLFAVRAERAADPGSVLLEWARAEENELGDAAAAMALYERVVAQDPEQVEAWTELARLQAAAGDAQGAFASLDALSARLDPEARLPVEVTKATLLMDELGRPGEALDLVRPILAQNPSDVSALRIVHRALSVPSTRRDAAELLENAAEAADDAEQRVAVIEALLAVSADDPELSAARGRWLAQLIESKENEPEEALRIALRGAEAAPGEEELWSFAEQMARRLERPEPVAEAYARALARGPEPSVAERLGRRMVEFHEEWFDEPEEVIALLERVLALCPDATWAFERLKLAFNAAGRWQELFALYDRRLALPLERAERLEILREASMAARDFAGDPERAIHYFEALHREAKNDGRVEASLERLYERHGKKRPLIDLLSARLERLDKAERSALRVRIAELWLELGEPEPALALGEALLDENERVEDAVRVLERILELPRARDAAEDGGPSALRRATAHLERHYESVGQVVDLVRVLGIQHSVAESREERRELLERIVNLRLRDLDDTEGAFDAVSELVLLDPGNLTYRKQLGELSRRIGADARRVEVLIAAQDAEVPVDVRAALLNEAAQVRRYSLAEAEGASALYRKVLGLAEAPPPAQLEAARALSELLRAGGAAEERVNVLERLADLETDAAARRAALGEAAELAFEALGDAPRAIAAYRLRLADDAKDLEAMDGLCRALEAIARWDELIEALEARAAIVPEADARRDRVRIARLHADVKEDRAAAIVAFRRVAELYGSDRETFTALSDLLAQERRWDELAELLVEEIERETERERQRHLELELGALHEQRTGKRLAALEAYVAGEDWQSAIRVAGAAHTDGETGRRVCARLLELSTSVWLGSKAGPETEPARAADWAITELGARLLEDGRYADVVERLLAGSELPFPERRRRELRREAACLTADRLGDAERAIELFQALLAEDPADEVARGSVTRLALLLEEQERFEELVELWKTQAEARSRLGDVAGAQVLWARAGELAETRLGDRERALAAYSAGAELGGEACLEALARVYSESGELDLAARALERLCAQSTGDALGERALELAEIYVSLGRAARAREALEQSLPKVVEGAKLRARLAGLYREAHDWLALALLLEDEANRAVDPKAKLALLWE
ncbi:MAG: tetratricopeptide repeat protein, partial [Pseudomonadota bacterium]